MTAEWPDILEEKPFLRPDTNVVFRLCNRMLPPQPDGQVVLGYGELRGMFRKEHYLWGIPMLVCFIGLTLLQFKLLPVLAYSPFSALVLAITWLYDQVGWLTLILVLPAYIGLRSWRSKASQRRERERRRAGQQHVGSVGVLNSLAVLEEQWFREGAENWTGRQRFLSNLSFGLTHMANFVYPFTAILPLTLGGYLFMRVYLAEFERSHDRRRAVLASSLVHRVYNRVALISIGINLVYLGLSLAFDLPHLHF